MRFFEVQDEVRDGFRVSMKPTPGINLGGDEDSDGFVRLPLGSSLRNVLTHPEDLAEAFYLLYGKLEHTSAGLMLIAQPPEEREKDTTALVLVERCDYAPAGIKRVDVAYGKGQPECVTHVREVGLGRDLYLFHPGDGLYIDWDDPTTGRRRFIIAWDGRELSTLICRPRSARRLPRKQPNQKQQPGRPTELTVGPSAE